MLFDVLYIRIVKVLDAFNNSTVAPLNLFHLCISKLLREPATAYLLYEEILSEDREGSLQRCFVRPF